MGPSVVLIDIIATAPIPQNDTTEAPVPMEMCININGLELAAKVALSEQA